MRFYTGMQRWLAMRRLRRATTEAVHMGLGGQRRRWLLSADPTERTIEAQTWVTEQLVSVRPPRGINTGGLLVKLLRDADGQQRYVWAAQIPSFARSAPQDVGSGSDTNARQHNWLAVVRTDERNAHAKRHSRLSHYRMAV